MNTENSKTNKPQKFILNAPQRLDLKTLNKQVALKNLSVYYTWKNIKKEYKNNTHKVIAPTWNDEFELRDGSYAVSNIQDFIEYIIKNHETLPTNPLLIFTSIVSITYKYSK